MNNADILKPEYFNLLGWKPHYDTNEITISNALTQSDSGEFYTQKHPAMDLSVIQSTLPRGRDLSSYLTEKVEDSTVEMINDILQYRQVNGYGKTLLANATLLNKIGWRNDVIVNRNRFVGFQIRLRSTAGLRIVLNEIGLISELQEKKVIRVTNNMQMRLSGFIFYELNIKGMALKLIQRIIN